MTNYGSASLKFKMLRRESLLRAMRKGDWFRSLALKDVYFHVLTIGIIYFRNAFNTHF